jgi:hypothetical protein
MLACFTGYFEILTDQDGVDVRQAIATAVPERQLGALMHQTIKAS